jgi:hypothetical protein
MDQAAPQKNGYANDLNPEQGRELFDKAAQFYLGISGVEFIRRWEAGYYDEDPDDPDVVEMMMLLPFAR